MRIKELKRYLICLNNSRKEYIYTVETVSIASLLQNQQHATTFHGKKTEKERGGEGSSEKGEGMGDMGGKKEGGEGR